MTATPHGRCASAQSDIPADPILRAMNPELRRALAAIALWCAAVPAWAAEPALNVSPQSLWVAQNEAPAAPSQSAPGLAPQREPRKDYTLPALEIVGFDFLLNRFNHKFSGSHDYDVSLDSIRRNLRSSWVTDRDPFKINQFGHPYQGSMYHGFARSSGPRFLGVARLHVCRQHRVGDRGREHAALPQ